MKPRLRCMRKLWWCAAPNWRQTSIVGIGYTPDQAYDDWWKLGGRTA